MMTIAEQLIEEGRQKGLLAGREEGLQDGVLTGKRDALTRVQTQRFGTLPTTWAAESVQRAGVEQLDAWIDRAVVAGSLEEALNT